jgi:hypothetical protein
MATTPTTRVTQLARRYRIDIDTAVFPASNYVQLVGVEDAKLIEERRVEDDEMYDDAGAGREAVTGYSWRIEAKLAYSTNLAGTVLDTVHTFLRGKFKATRDSSAQAEEFGIRFYDRAGLDDGMSSEGRCYVKAWTLPGGKGRDAIDVVLQGQGALADIVNPAGSLLPTVTGLDPAAGLEAGGELISIFGQHYAPGGVDDVTDVDFGATPAAGWTTISDSHIVAIAPAGAGTVAARVTTAAGQSADTAADNYIYT